ncbi:mCG133599, isoform CRA_a, partial [Mus musculus]
IWTRVGLASRSKPIRSLQGRSFLLPALGKVRKVARSCGKRRWLGRGLGCGVPGRLPRLLWNASELQALDAGVQGVERQTRMDRLVRCSGPSGAGVLASRLATGLTVQASAAEIMGLTARKYPNAFPLFWSCLHPIPTAASFFLNKFTLKV